MISTTSQIMKLARDGRANPHDVAALMQLRGLVAAKRRRINFREHPVFSVAMFVCLFVGSFFGLRRQD